MAKAALVPDEQEVLTKGSASFAVEARLVRELGERLVKEPEIALLELIKNSYDADAAICRLEIFPDKELVVVDDGQGMTLEQFQNAWMKIGTSSKEKQVLSDRFQRPISGEKGIGRFAVRYLGRSLELTSIAYDAQRNTKTRLLATFDWPKFDKYEDLGQVQIPFILYRARPDDPTGLTLRIGDLRASTKGLNLRQIRTASIELISPFASLIQEAEKGNAKVPKRGKEVDPGFSLSIRNDEGAADEFDVASELLKQFVLRVKIKLRNGRLTYDLWRNGDAESSPTTHISDRIETSITSLDADIRFYPRRKGTFRDIKVDGRRAWTWVREHSGIAVFDGRFRVYPYGRKGDDWLGLSASKARNDRDPSSSVAMKHFPMTPEVHQSTSLNYMLRLPYPFQLVGAVCVRSTRTASISTDDSGLIPSADREGFLHNKTFDELRDIIRGGVELIANGDRELQHALEQELRKNRSALFQEETKKIIAEIESNTGIRREDKQKIIKRIEQIDRTASDEAEYTKKREQSLEIMSLLGVVAGFMTHEFGVAVHHLQKSFNLLERLSKKQPELREQAQAIKTSIDSLEEFVTYSEGYIRGSQALPLKPYAVAPRIVQMTRVFGRYASERGIAVETKLDTTVSAPKVPVSLYNGLVLNLYTNALKAVTARTGKGERRIAFRAWNNEDEHFLEVSDTGIGIPIAMRKRVFDPLFTTTETNRDPLGSGMGLGLTLVKRGVEAFSGKVEVIDPPPGFSTCVQIRIPLEQGWL